MSATSAPSNVGGMESNVLVRYGAHLLFGLAIVAFIISIIMASTFLGKKDGEWEQIRKEAMTNIWPASIIGSILFFIASSIYVVQDGRHAMYFLLAISCLTLGISYSALALSVITKS